MRVALLSDGWNHTLVIRRCLLTAGHGLAYCETVHKLVSTLESDDFDAVVLSHDALDSSGLERLNEIRGRYGLTIPVIMVTPHQSESYVVRALDEGADDYLVSPVRPREFLARLEAITRRTWHTNTLPRPIQTGRLQVNLATRRVLMDGVPVHLTTKDFDLAVLFLQNVGRLISRARILQTVWGTRKSAKSRTLDTHISRVRTRLELNESSGWRFSAVYRRGYRLERVDESTARDPDPQDDRALQA
jgi:DNA-binding response OmpR family regulator